MHGVGLVESRSAVACAAQKQDDGTGHGRRMLLVDAQGPTVEPTGFDARQRRQCLDIGAGSRGRVGAVQHQRGGGRWAGKGKKGVAVPHRVERAGYEGRQPEAPFRLAGDPGLADQEFRGDRIRSA